MNEYIHAHFYYLELVFDKLKLHFLDVEKNLKLYDWFQEIYRLDLDTRTFFVKNS